MYKFGKKDMSYQKDLAIHITEWKIEGPYFPADDPKRIPMAKLYIENGMKDHTRYEITVAPREDHDFGYVADLYISRMHNLTWDSAKPFYKDFRIFESITRLCKKELVFPIIIDKMMENTNMYQYAEELKPLVEARKAYFKLLERYIEATGKQVPWVEMGPKVT